MIWHNAILERLTNMAIIKICSDAHVVVQKAHEKGRLGYGKAACGVIIVEADGAEVAYSSYLGEKTVPEAEFHGLLLALDKACAHSRDEIEIWLDSDLVVKWMTGKYRLKKDHIRPLFDKAKTLEARYKKVSYFHHSRETPLAKKADEVARQEYEKNNGTQVR